MRKYCRSRVVLIITVFLMIFYSNSGLAKNTSHSGVLSNTFKNTEDEILTIGGPCKNNIFQEQITSYKYNNYLVYYNNHSIKSEEFSDEGNDELAEEELPNIDRISVLMYHHIVEDSQIGKKNQSIIKKSQFERDMKIIHDRVFKTLSAEEFQNWIEGKQKIGQKSVLITFDDGYESNIKIAYPIMKSYNQKGIVHIMGNYLRSREQMVDSKYEMILKEDYDLKDYNDVFDFGMHTYELHFLKKNSRGRWRPYITFLSKDQIYRDLKLNLDMGLYPIFAYPYGEVTKSTYEVMDELGIDIGFTIKKGYVYRNTDLKAVPRFNMSPGMSNKTFVDTIEGSRRVR
ncbi:MAG: polysaccharide deacetylase family protein [Tissierellales bacterium]|nr:polysaccharide deacetylase family protein [Tissierellales bacterium]